MAARRNAADSETLAALKRTQGLGRRQLEQDLRALMSTPQLRRVAFHIIDKICNLHGGSYVDSPTRTAFNEGKRAVGNELRLRLMEATPLDYVHMLNEQLTSHEDEVPSAEPEAD